MLDGYFLRDAADYHWHFFDAVCEGDTGYAWSLSRFTSTVPEFAGRQVVIDGISRFRLRDGLIAEYHESVNGGIAMAQLGVARSEEHTSELQSLMRISYAVFCLTKKNFPD